MPAKPRRWKDAKEKRDGGAFITLPLAVLNSRAYIEASPYARMLLIDLFMQYRGDNNGDLCAAWKFMKPRGWRSEATLNKAKRELIELGLIEETRKGARPNKASLYAVTWCALDYCGGKLDISPKGFHRGAYKLRDPMPPIAFKKQVKNAGLTTPAEVEKAA
jgi:hypothetical protein